LTNKLDADLTSKFNTTQDAGDLRAKERSTQFGFKNGKQDKKQDTQIQMSSNGQSEKDKEIPEELQASQLVDESPVLIDVQDPKTSTSYDL